MRKYFILLASAIGLSAYAGTKIEWSSTRHDFGAFDESTGIATAVFTFKNTGDEPLVITGARANCGCTTPRYSADVVAPGDTASLVVSYDPGGRPGRFEKKVYIDTNTDPTRSTLTIAGVVIGESSTINGRYPVIVGPLRLAHPAALLGTIKKGQLKSAFESGYNASADTLYPVIENAPKWLSVTPIPSKVTPGEQISFNYNLNSNLLDSWDIVTDTITIRPYAGSVDAIDVPVVVTVNEDFSTLSDKELAASPIIRTEISEPTERTGNLVFTLTVHNDGKRPLVLHRLYTRTEGVISDMKPETKVKSGKSAKITISVPTDKTRNEHTVLLNLINNDPASPKQTVKLNLTH